MFGTGAGGAGSRDGAGPVPGPDSAGPVLGIDPGVSRCGYGAVRREGASMGAVSFGVIRTAPHDGLPARLALLESELESLVRELRPSAMAVERVLFQNNARTAISVGQASGLALAVASRAGVPVIHYSPNEVKLAVCGYGGADKLQVQQMVQRLLRLPEVPRPPDAADALALAVCHAWGAPLRDAVDVTGRQRGPSGDVPVPALSRAIAVALARKEAR
ncbi:MAG: crossover junction endodeoxyribonuclease RuvC [Acidimicrobiia bacterium]